MGCAQSGSGRFAEGEIGKVLDVFGFGVLVGQDERVRGACLCMVAKGLTRTYKLVNSLLERLEVLQVSFPLQRLLLGLVGFGLLLLLIGLALASAAFGASWSHDDGVVGLF